MKITVDTPSNWQELLSMASEDSKTPVRKMHDSGLHVSTIGLTEKIAKHFMGKTIFAETIGTYLSGYTSHFVDNFSQRKLHLKEVVNYFQKKGSSDQKAALGIQKNSQGYYEVYQFFLDFNDQIISDNLRKITVKELDAVLNRLA